MRNVAIGVITAALWFALSYVVYGQQVLGAGL